MRNFILWYLDNELDDKRFERLCTDLLYRHGYKEIIPLGGVHDRGRDAEMSYDEELENRRVFFQYSLNKNWKKKLMDELEKVRRNHHRITEFVFVTSQKVTGASRDKYIKLAASKYGWQLSIYDFEWLRLQLEEVHPDLANKYLDIGVNLENTQAQYIQRPAIPKNLSDEKAWKLYNDEDYEAAAVEFKSWLKQHDKDANAWQALAWCQYSLLRYQEALIAINRALSLNKRDAQILSLKASILTEDGISKRSKASLIQARNIFSPLVESSRNWQDYYNYGNVLSALGEYEEAQFAYIKATGIDDRQAEVWKNLGTVYYHLHNHDAEIDCYDKALALEPNKAEALASKGVTLLIVYERAIDGVALIERALMLDEKMAQRWPIGWFWLGQGYKQLGDLRTALDKVNTGLDNAPDDCALLKLKGSIISSLWREDQQFLSEALIFFEFQREVLGDKPYIVAELCQLYQSMGQEDYAWSLLGASLEFTELDITYYVRDLGYSLDQCLTVCQYLDAYNDFRKTCPLDDYGDLFIAQKERIIPSEEFWFLLIAGGSIPFSLCYDIFVQMKRESSCTNAIVQMYTTLKKFYSSFIPRISEILADSIRTENFEQTAARLATVLLLIPDIALIELSRQSGFIAARFLTPKSILDDNLPEDLEEWQQNILAETLVSLNKQLHLLKDEG